MTMNLSVLAVVLGLIVALPAAFSLKNPTAFADLARKFPRSKLCGYALVALATFWFLYYLKQESISDFAAYKPAMFIGFILLGILTCIFVTDFLAVRGFAVVLLLLAKLMVDSARWAESEWRLVIMVWAYALVIAGMWLTVSPWRLRDLINWATANEQRIRLTSSIRLAFGILVIILGLTTF